MKKLKIERPDWSLFVDEFGVDFDKWFDSEIEPLNKILEGAEWVHCFKDLERNCWECDSQPHEKDTHKALLIGIEPIKRESAEEILNEILESNMHGNIMDWDVLHEKIHRAKRALENEGEND